MYATKKIKGFAFEETPFFGRAKPRMGQLLKLITNKATFQKDTTFNLPKHRRVARRHSHTEELRELALGSEKRNYSWLI